MYEDYDILEEMKYMLEAGPDYQKDIYGDELYHYGTKRHSGRYPWGSGENPYQHQAAGQWAARVQAYKKEGLNDSQIAELMGVNSSTQLRDLYSIARTEERNALRERAVALREKGYSLQYITKEMGYKNDSSVRSLLDEKAHEKMNAAQNTANFLMDKVDELGPIDLGAGMGASLNVSEVKLREAMEIMKAHGYVQLGGRIPQVTNPGKMTTLKVMAPPGTPPSAVYKPDQIHYLDDYISYDGGDTFKEAFQYPASMDSKRLIIRYKEDGGEDMDGVIELRRGVKDLSLGNSAYAQVRILVDDDHYLKGMAVYADDLPDGVDVRFNTNKSNTKSKMDVLKEVEPANKQSGNPFGALIKEHGGQYTYIDDDGKEKLGLINKKSDEGDWESWADKLPTQFLAKQNKVLINKQLKETLADKNAEMNDILSIENPTIRRKMLMDFADGCDSDAVQLKVAALPRQRYQVILPVKSLKDNEVYAPNYQEGETVALVRYPHGGTFEIPIVTVNNKNKEAINRVGKNPKDVVGINSNVASRLSGADFDGDFVMVLPFGKDYGITSTHKLKDLEGFDPKMEYGGKQKGTFKELKKENVGKEMGIITNLINDMTLKGAKEDEIARAVKHSMVVIDANKHSLDYKQSEKDNRIDELKRKYQSRDDTDDISSSKSGKGYGGASTLFSRAKSTTYNDKIVGSPKINLKGKPYYDPTRPEGAYIYTRKKETYIDRKTGKVKERQSKSTRMADTDDAYSLVSRDRTAAELAYAEYANSLKSMANRARMISANTPTPKTDPVATKEYQLEIKSITTKINNSKKNQPRERRAQNLARIEINAIKADNPDLTKSELKKIRQRAITKARIVAGASRESTKINLTDREWDAIRHNAVTSQKITELMKYVDGEKMRDFAIPKQDNGLTTAQINRVKAMENRGYTNEQIADRVGVSVSTVIKYLE